MNRKKIIPVLLIAFAAVITLAVILSAPWYIYVIASLLALGVMVYGSASVCAGFYTDVICSGNKSGDKIIAVTFDDGPDKSVTPAILNILNKHNVKAAFFCVGRKILKSPDLAKRIDREGHIIGNHSYSHHFLFDLFGRKQMSDEIRVTGNLIHRNTGKRPLMFRPPYGVTNPPLARALKDKGYTVIGWSLKSGDTFISDHNKLMNRIKRKLGKGDIILFHDNISHLPGFLDEFLGYAAEKGYKIVRLDELIYTKAYE